MEETLPSILPRRLGKTGLIKNTFYSRKRWEEIPHAYTSTYSLPRTCTTCGTIWSNGYHDIVRKNSSFIKTIAFFVPCALYSRMDPLTGEPSVSLTIEPSQEDITIRSISDYLNEELEKRYISPSMNFSRLQNIQRKAQRHCYVLISSLPNMCISSSPAASII